VAGKVLFKPKFSTMIGKLYWPGDARRDSGLTIFYMGINAGAFFAPIICATWIGATYGFKYGFLAAGIGMIFGIVVFQFLKGMLGHVGKEPVAHEGWKPVFIVLAGALAIVPVIYFLLSKSAWLGNVLMVLLAGLAFYFITSALKSKDKVQLHRYIAMLILFMANMLFWALFEQAGSSLNFLARDFVDSPFNFSLFQSFNPLFIISLAPLFAMLWPWLYKKNINPSNPRKFAVAFIGVGFGFFILVRAIKADTEGGKVFWGSIGSARAEACHRQWLDGRCALATRRRRP